MARGYVTIGGKACNAKKAYLVKGKLTYKGKRAYVVKNGKTCLSWSGTEAGEMIVTESGTITIPSGVSLVDIFCVGGGGGAGGWSQTAQYSTDYTLVGYTEFHGGGGGGGHTETAFDVEVTPGETLTVIIGAGGRTGRSFCSNVEPYNTFSYGDLSYLQAGADGGATSVKRGSTTLCTASGGSGGARRGGVNTDTGVVTCAKGGNGGSGGCAGSIYNMNANYSVFVYNGGVDGGDGDPGSNAEVGAGQGYTTRAFEETTGTLYSNGGDGYGSTAAATANSGDGANSAVGLGIDSSGYVNRYGGSGIVIIRWKEREV